MVEAMPPRLKMGFKRGHSGKMKKRRRIALSTIPEDDLSMQTLKYAFRFLFATTLEGERSEQDKCRARSLCLADSLENYDSDLEKDDPPVSTFMEHSSTLSPNVRVLPSHWADSWCKTATVTRLSSL